ncbi:MAG TPA: hypothetical protein VG103_05420 [Chthoniobacterales bacterium]|jgi:hypothetical protein|nr:hypothetical protein [Chthoniobacterales bacterium]
MPHTVEQLRRGVIDFCSLLDQAAVAFAWEWLILPHPMEETKKQDKAVIGPGIAMEVIGNATVESSLISIRALDEFFDPGDGRPNDIRSHYYSGYRSPGHFLQNPEFHTIGRRIAHLTLDRVDDSTKPWQITELITRAYKLSENFLSFVVEGEGKQYLPKAPFDTASRLFTSRQMDEFMQRVLHQQQERFV